MAFEEGLGAGRKLAPGKHRNFTKGMPGAVNMKNMFFAFERDFIDFYFAVCNDIETVTIISF